MEQMVTQQMVNEFIISIIFSNANKEIVLEGNSDDFYKVFMDIIKVFADDVDEKKHKISYSSYIQNSEQFRKKIQTFSDSYKKDIPQVQQILAFFKNQQENEWFFIGFNKLSQEERLKIDAFLDLLNTGKPYEETMNEINSIFGNVCDKYLIYSFLGNTRKKFYGESDKNKRKCRYCHRGFNEVKFSQDAHAISDLLGNNVLFSYEECDECNNYFGSHCEQDFGEFLRLERCFYGIKGRSGIPKIGIPYVSFEGESKKFKNLKEEERNTSNIVPDLKYKLSYNPQNLYRALVKFFIGLVPVEFADNFYHTGSWVRNEYPNTKDSFTFTLTFLPTIKRLKVRNTTEHPYLYMYLRKDNDKSLPYAVGEFHVINYIFVFIVPLTEPDNKNFCNKEDYERFWSFFKHFNSIKGWQDIDLSKDQTTSYTTPLKWVAHITKDGALL